MNKYDENYIFRIANINDVDTIMNIIKEDWSSSHILANDKEFFLYEFAHGEKIDFILAINRDTQEIEALLGFIQYTEEFIPNETDCGGAMFMVRKHCKVPFLGIELMQRLYKMALPRLYIGNGSNPKTALPLQKRILKHKTGRLQQFYRLSDRVEYRVANIINKKIFDITEKRQLDIKKYNTAEELFKEFNLGKYRGKKPFKDKWYIKKRYFNHPIYQYEVYGVLDESVETVIIGRKIEINRTSVFRIVDILGDYNKFAFIGKAIQKLIDQNLFEYVDIYEHGVPEHILKNAGFIERSENDFNIIPNYFEPYVAQNVEIYFHVSDSNCVIFKGDGDQDRPNQR